MITALADERLDCDRAALVRGLVCGLASAGAPPAAIGETLREDGSTTSWLMFRTGFTALALDLGEDRCGLMWSARSGPAVPHFERSLA